MKGSIGVVRKPLFPKLNRWRGGYDYRTNYRDLWKRNTTLGDTHSIARSECYQAAEKTRAEKTTYQMNDAQSRQRMKYS